MSLNESDVFANVNYEVKEFNKRTNFETEEDYKRKPMEYSFEKKLKTLVGYMKNRSSYY